MPSLNRTEKVDCLNCGTQTTKLNLARQKKRCSIRTLTCCSCTNFSTKSRAEMNYNFAKKDSKATAWVVHKWKICDEDFHCFYLLLELKVKEHGAESSRSSNC